jgi:hypothetical protein
MKITTVLGFVLELLVDDRIIVDRTLKSWE